MDDFPLAKYPLTGSHEPAGEIVALGDEAEGGKVKVGDRVAGLFHREICCTYTSRSAVVTELMTDKCPDCTQFSPK
jgi:D-arabinose 1-dehydrogenase-like Zn-dependent alcohol dehydrogenase